MPFRAGIIQDRLIFFNFTKIFRNPQHESIKKLKSRSADRNYIAQFDLKGTETKRTRGKKCKIAKKGWKRNRNGVKAEIAECINPRRDKHVAATPCDISTNRNNDAGRRRKRIAAPRLPLVLERDDRKALPLHRRSIAFASTRGFATGE